MPTYQYKCKNCGFELEELQSMTEPPLLRCPECHTDNLARIMGTGAGLIFKGSGFYLTDYKKEGGGAKGKPKGKEQTEEKKSPGSGEKGSGEKGSGEKGSGEKGSGEKGSGEKGSGRAPD